MKHLIALLLFCVLVHTSTFGQNTIEIGPNQSMSIIGKGPGQDAAINPYSGENSIAKVKNIGDNPFYVRIQLKGRVITNVELKEKEIKEFVLKKDFELYFDSEFEGKARITFKKLKEK